MRATASLDSVLTVFPADLQNVFTLVLFTSSVAS